MAFSEVCETVGDDVIKKKDLKFWFDQFKQGIFDDNKEPVADMRDILRSDKCALRVCILYESLKSCQLENNHKLSHHPLFAKYINFCKVIGEDALEYREFDFWFYRFLNGEYDLNYEKENNQKSLELSDMPLDIMKNIVDYLDIFDRSSLSQTSRSLRKFTQSQRLFHHSLGLFIHPASASISIDIGASIEYISMKNAFVKKTKQSKQLFENVAHWKQAILDFKNILKFPKLHLEFLKIETVSIEFYPVPGLKRPIVADDIAYEFGSQFNFKNHINVKKLFLKLNCLETFLNILPSLKPGYLTTINVLTLMTNKEETMRKVVELEQWKQAEHFTLIKTKFVVPLSHLFHFKQFEVRYKKLSVEDIRQMKEILFKSPGFERCKLAFEDRINELDISQEFGDVIPGTPNIYHYSIPNSTEVFEITVEWSGNSIEIMRNGK